MIESGKHIGHELKLLTVKIKDILHPPGPELLEWHELKKAVSVPQELLGDVDTLNKYYKMGKDIAEGRFGAVAFTQIQPQTFLEYGLDPQYTNCMYITSQFFRSYRGTLLVNPVCDFSEPSYGCIDGCGSIYKAKVHMVVCRPLHAKVKSIVFEPPYEPEYMDREFNDVLAAVIEHEYIHLLGGSAFSYGDRVINMLKKQDWRKIDGLYRKTGMKIEEIVLDSINHGYSQWLIYEENQFYMVTVETPVSDLDNITVIDKKLVTHPFLETSRLQN